MRSIRLVFAACLLSAAPLAAQATATVCKDATTSVSAGRGACSGHGGVDAKASAKAAKAAAKMMKKEEAEKKQASKPEAKVDKAADKASKAEVKAEKASDKAATTTVGCADGSKSAGGRGACSGHGGIAVSNPVQKKAEKAETKAAKAEAKSEDVAKASSGKGEDNNPAGAIAKCKDGMYSHSANRRGACSRHGGVASWT